MKHSEKKKKIIKVKKIKFYYKNIVYFYKYGAM